MATTYSSPRYIQLKNEAITLYTFNDKVLQSFQPYAAVHGLGRREDLEAHGQNCKMMPPASEVSRRQGSILLYEAPMPWGKLPPLLPSWRLCPVHITLQKQRVPLGSSYKQVVKNVINGNDDAVWSHRRGRPKLRGHTHDRICPNFGDSYGSCGAQLHLLASEW